MSKRNEIKQTQRKNARSKGDLKDMVKSVRLSKSQYEIIEKQAVEHEMTPSSYMVFAATNYHNETNPELIGKVQNVFNTIRDVVKEHAPEKLDEVEREVSEIWSSLS